MATTPTAATYGFASAFFNADPELKKLLASAIAGKWTNEMFQGKFMDTQWYRSRSAAIRQFTDLETRDPAEMERQVRQKQLLIYDQFSQLGLETSYGQTRSLAYQSLKFAWDENQLRDVIVDLLNYGDLGGTPATLEMQIKGMAGDYGVTLNSSQTNDFINGLLTDRYTEDNLRDFLKDSAKSKYQGMAGMLDQGFTVRQVASPYVDSYARLMEVGADTVDLNDNLIQQALQGTPQQGNQPPVMKSVYQFERDLRRDPRWLRTKNAHQSATDAVMSIAKDWGLVG